MSATDEMKAFIRKTWNTIFKQSMFGGRLLLMLAVVGLLIGAMILSGPKPDDTFDPFATPTELSITQQPSNLITPALSQSNIDQTSGVILAAIMVVIIIIGGTILFLRGKDNIR